MKKNKIFLTFLRKSLAKYSLLFWFCFTKRHICRLRQCHQIVEREYKNFFLQIYYEDRTPFKRKLGNRCRFFYYKLKICQNFAVEFCEYKISETLISSGNTGQFQLVCIFLTRFVSGPFFLCFISVPWVSFRYRKRTNIHGQIFINQTLLNNILGPTLVNQHW